MTAATGSASPWKTARVLAIRDETPRAKTFRFELDEPSTHRAGQHYVVRLTAEDGYTASRSYSVASAPDGSREFELTVERLEHGEVSTFLHDVVEPGDELEVRGPIGGWFVWDGETAAVLVGGGSGVVPLMAMLRYAAEHRAGESAPRGGVGALTRRPVLPRRVPGAGDERRVHARGATREPAPSGPPGARRPRRRHPPRRDRVRVRVTNLL